MKLSQRDLGSYAGLSRENMNRQLGELRDQGLIQAEGSLITILDREGLEACASAEQ
jgi:CRP-like cAMP-binding protein